MITIDDFQLKFPQTLPNDLEAFMVFYPRKFPLIVPYYEEVARKVAIDYKGFQEYGNWAKDELWKGYEKINKDYQNGDQNSLEFLVDIDQRMHKLCCFRFWVVNYLFADGPLHDYFVSNLKALIRKFVDATEDIEDYEHKVLLAERDLMQTEYADLYLDSALKAIDLANLLQNNPRIKELVAEVTQQIDKHKKEDADQINALWKQIVEIIKDPNNPECEELRKAMKGTFEHAHWVGQEVLVYHKLTHAIEFREQNKDLLKRHEEMVSRINKLKNEAKSKLSPEDYELFELSYEQARNFGMYKDVMGAIDPEWLPMWFGLHKQVRKLVNKPEDSNIKPGGHS